MRTSYEIWQNSKRLEDLQKDVGSLKAEKEDLAKSVAYKGADEFIEAQARNALNMVKPNEQLYVTPQGVLGDSAGRNTDLTAVAKTVSNPQLWLSLFFDLAR